MTTRIIMNVSRPNGSGGTYKAGTEYDLPDDLAELWRGQGICRRLSVRSEQTGAVIQATSGNYPGAPALDDQFPLMGSIRPDGGVAFDEAARRALRGGGVLTREYPIRRLKKRAAVVDDMTNAATVWGNAKTGCTLTDDAVSARLDLGAKSALQIDITASWARFHRIFSTPMTFTGPIALWMELDFSPTSGVNLYFTSDAAQNFAAKNVRVLLPFNGLKKGMNCIVIHPSEDGSTTNKTLTSTGGDSLANAITGLRIEFNNWEGHRVKLHGLYHGGKSKGLVLFNWDDGDQSHYTIFNMLRQRGLVGNFSLITGKLKKGFSAYLTDAQLDTMYNYGSDFLPHSETHPSGGLAVLSAADAMYELTESKRKLIEWGYPRAADIFTWPENAYDSNDPNIDLIELARQAGYVASRGSKGSYLPTAQGIDQPMRLPSVDLGGKTLAQAKKYIDAAELYGQAVIIYGHRGVGTETTPAAGGVPPANTIEWYLSDYGALLDYVADRVEADAIDVGTYSDLRQTFRF